MIISMISLYSKFVQIVMKNSWNIPDGYEGQPNVLIW